MSGKRIDFMEKAKDISEEILPIEKDQILTYLENISGEIIIDYMMGVDDGVERLLFFKNFVGSKLRPKLSKLLLEQMNPAWLSGLRDVVFLLSSRDIEEKVEEIVNATLGHKQEK